MSIKINKGLISMQLFNLSSITLALLFERCAIYVFKI